MGNSLIALSTVRWAVALSTKVIAMKRSKIWIVWNPPLELRYVGRWLTVGEKTLHLRLLGWSLPRGWSHRVRNALAADACNPSHAFSGNESGELTPGGV